ncbi:MAG: ABC transporter ATP-binding protein [Planctomycetes bacterium]|nr:ABC transporter ATP-binding protein [Planctomycetota bacterium]
MQKPFLAIDRVTKKFGSVTALRSVSLNVGPDELLVVLGPTGAGKTTLLRTIAGLEAPQEGTIQMAGEDVTSRTPAERDVALVFQDFSLYPNWTVRRNLEFPLRAPGRRLSEDEIAQRVSWAAELLKIAGLLDRRSQRLSGGEMQRVAIGRAIVRRPRVFLMDEPLTNLDAKLREALRVELVCLRRELKTPMVYVTHDQVEALSMGDRIVVLGEGRVLQTGSPEDIFRRPVSPVVARQLGQPAINLLKVERSGGAWVADNGVAVAAAGEGGGNSMILGVRPEDIQPRGGEREARVTLVEDMGPTKILLVDWGGCNVHIVAPATADIHQGDTIHPQVDPERIILWPEQTI